LFVQAAPPPAPAVPAPAASAYVTIAAKDIDLVLLKAKRSETAVVRYQIFLKTDVDQSAAEAAPCAWRVRAYVQRTLCFSSMTGMLSCADPISQELPEAETGAAAATDFDLCGLEFTGVRDAQDRLKAGLVSGAAARFDEDYRLKLRPILVAAGVQARRVAP
jgi:hypothetical protein